MRDTNLCKENIIIYIYTYIYIYHIYTYMYLHVYTCINLCIHTSVCVLYIYIFIFVSSYIQLCIINTRKYAKLLMLILLERNKILHVPFYHSANFGLYGYKVIFFLLQHFWEITFILWEYVKQNKVNSYILEQMQYIDPLGCCYREISNSALVKNLHV